MTENPEQSPSKKRPKKGLIAAGVIVAVLVVAGVGAFVWHEQPSFCAAICHDPMDPYLATYEADTDGVTTDKWGDEVQASAMMAPMHREAGVTCLDCHVPTLNQQVSEGLAWVSGDFESPLSEQTNVTLAAASEMKASDDMCLKSGCHAGINDRYDLEQATSDLEFNPHALMHGDDGGYDCSDCHKAHRASNYSCMECHVNDKNMANQCITDEMVPEGWLTWEENQQVLADHGQEQ